jgi:hypothetical protein
MGGEGDDFAPWKRPEGQKHLNARQEQHQLREERLQLTETCAGLQIILSLWRRRLHHLQQRHGKGKKERKVCFAQLESSYFFI